MMKTARIKAGETALQILLQTAGEEDIRRKIENMLTAIVFTKREMREMGRTDLLKKVAEIQKNLLKYRLINWGWALSNMSQQHLTKDAQEEIKKVQKVILEIEVARLQLIDMLLEVYEESLTKLPEVSL